MEDFHKYVKIHVVGHKENEGIFATPEDVIIIEEKMDGGNFRFAVINGKIIFGSRTQQLTSDAGEETNMNKQFKRCAEFIKTQIRDTGNVPDSLIFYGECMVKHTMHYAWEEIPPFLGFDIFSLKENKYLDNISKRDLFSAYGLPVVPLVGLCNACEIKNISDDDVPISAYAPITNPTQKAEGIVFKNYDKQIFAKYVRDEFKEDNKKTFGGSPKFNKDSIHCTACGAEIPLATNNTEFIFKYCTNARIDKMIFKLIDEGNALDMALMSQLPKRIYWDIVEEHWQEIFDTRWTIDLAQLRKKIPERCKAVLSQVVVNNALAGDSK